MSDSDAEALERYASARLLAALKRRGSMATPEQMHEAAASLLAEMGVPAEALRLDALQFRRALNSETDRGAALFAAAYLDTRFEALLSSFFVNDAGISKGILTGNGGLATFSARIDIAFLLGLLPRSIWRDLRLIRKIRNDFAHNPEAIKFSHGPIARRCRELAHAPLADFEEPRSRYIQSVMGVVGYIDGIMHQLVTGELASCTEPPSQPPKREISQMGLTLIMDRVADILERDEEPSTEPLKRDPEDPDKQ